MASEREAYNKLHKMWDVNHKVGSPTYFIRKLLITKLVKRYFPNKNISVLDIGCGTGDYVELFSGFEYEGLDISDYAIKKLRKKYPSKKFILGDIFKINFEKKFDLIFFSEVLEHIEEEALFIEKVYSLLKKGGYILFSVPYNPKLWNYSDIQSHHKRRYTKRHVVELLKKFNIVQMLCYGFPMLRLYWKLTSPLRRTIQSKGSRSFWIMKYLKFVFLIDLLFLKTNYGIGLIVLAKKKD